MDHSETDQVLADRGHSFIILAQTPRTIEPTKGALDNPTFGQDVKASGIPEARSIRDAPYRLSTADVSPFPSAD